MYFIKHKKIHSESKRKYPQKVTAVLRPLQARIRGQLVIYRTDSQQEVRKQETLPSSDILQLLLRLLLQLQSTTPRYYYHYYCYYRLPRKICLPRLLLLPPYRSHLRLQSQELREVSFQKSLILYKNTSFLQPRLRRVIII